MRQQAANENSQSLWLDGLRTGPSAGGELHVIGITAFLRLLPELHSDRERFLSMLRLRTFLPHADAIKALWGDNSDGGPLYAQHILAIYVARLRRAGHAIENYRGIGYRIQEPGGGVAAEWAEQT
jgi:hypothetical protein